MLKIADIIKKYIKYNKKGYEINKKNIKYNRIRNKNYIR